MSKSPLSVGGLDQDKLETTAIPQFPVSPPDMSKKPEVGVGGQKTEETQIDQKDTTLKSGQGHLSAKDPDARAWRDECYRQQRKRTADTIGMTSSSPPSMKKTKEWTWMPPTKMPDLAGISLRYLNSFFPQYYPQPWLYAPPPWMFGHPIPGNFGTNSPQRLLLPQLQCLPPPFPAVGSLPPDLQNSEFFDIKPGNCGFQYQPHPPQVLSPASVPYLKQFHFPLPPPRPRRSSIPHPVVGNQPPLPQNSAIFHSTPSALKDPQPSLASPSSTSSPQSSSSVPKDALPAVSTPPPNSATHHPESIEFHKFIVFGLDQSCEDTFMSGADLSYHFSVFGHVQQVLLRGPLAFVTMSRREAAERIVAILHHTLYNGLAVECRQIFVSMEEFLQTLFFLESKTNPAFWTGGPIPGLKDLLRSRWFIHVLCSTAAKAYSAQVGTANDTKMPGQDGTPTPSKNRVEEQVKNILRKYWDDYQAAVGAVESGQHSSSAPC